MTFVNVYTVVVIAQLESGITVTLVATNHINTAAVVANIWMTQTLIYSDEKKRNSVLVHGIRDKK